MADFRSRLIIELEKHAASNAQKGINDIRQALRELAREADFKQIPVEFEEILKVFDSVADGAYDLNAQVKELQKTFESASKGKSNLSLIAGGESEIYEATKAFEQAITTYRKIEAELQRDLKTGTKLLSDDLTVELALPGVSEALNKTLNQYTQLKELQSQLVTLAKSFAAENIKNSEVQERQLKAAKEAESQFQNLLRFAVDRRQKEAKATQDAEKTFQDLIRNAIDRRQKENKGVQETEKTFQNLIREAINHRQNQQQVLESAEKEFQQRLRETIALRKEEQKVQAQTERDAEIELQRRLQESIRRKKEEQQAQANAQRGQTPLFLQFALFPAASLAQRAGAEGLSSALFSASDVLGIADNALIIKQNIGALAERLKQSAGPIGAVANVAAGLAAPLGATAAGFAATFAVIAPMAIAVVALTAVFQDLAKKFEEAKKKAEDYIQSQVKVNDLVAEGATTEDLTQNINNLQQRIASRQGTLDQYRPFLDDYKANSGIGGLNPFLTPQFDQRASDLTDGQVTSAAALVIALEQVQKETDTLTTELTAAQTVMGTYGVIVNDVNAEVAMWQGILTEQTRTRYEAEIEAAEFAKTATTEMLDARLDALSSESEQLIAARDELLAIGGEEADALHAQYGLRLQVIDVTYAALEAERELIGIREREREIADAQLKNQQRIQDNEKQRVELTKRFQEEIEEGEQRLQERLLKQKQDYQQNERVQEQKNIFDRQKMARDFDAQNEDDLVKAQERERAIDDKFQEDNAKAKEDHERRLAKIARDFNRQAANAIGQRGALAYYLAKQNRDDQIDDENKRYNALQRDRRQDYDRQKRELAQALEQQRQQRLRDYQRRLDEFNRQAQFELQQRQQKYQYDRQQLINDQINDTNLKRAKYTNDYNELTAHYNTMYTISVKHHNALQALANSLVIPSITKDGGTIIGGKSVGTGLSASSFTTSSEVKRMPITGSGGFAQPAMRKGGDLSISIPINGAGMSARQVVTVVDNTLYERLVEAGWET